LVRTPLFPVCKLQRGQLYYEYQQSVTAAAGAPNTRFFSANDVFDPDVSGAGHQPIGYDQMMLFYEHFAVFSSHITIRAVGLTSGDLACIGVYLAPDAVALTDPHQIIENGLIHSRLVEAKEVPKAVTLSLGCDVAKYFGKRRPRDIMDDEKLTGAVSTSPAEGVYFAVVGWCATAAVTWTVKYDVCISYDVMYFEPRKLASS